MFLKIMMDTGTTAPNYTITSIWTQRADPSYPLFRCLIQPSFDIVYKKESVHIHELLIYGRSLLTKMGAYTSDHDVFLNVQWAPAFDRYDPMPTSTPNIYEENLGS